LHLLQAELKDLRFPDHWTIEITCTPIAWQQAQQRAGGVPTTTAFSQLNNRVTVLNGAIFRALRSSYRRVIAHELGHVTCGCSDEYDAEKMGVRLAQHGTATASAD